MTAFFKRRPPGRHRTRGPLMDPRPPDARPPEESVVTRAQEGDVDAFEVLYRQHNGRVFALCLRMSGDRVRAQELMQDVFVRAWERLRSFRGDASFGSWLHRLAANVVLTSVRSDRRRNARVTLVDDVEGYSHGEIAELTGLAEGTIRAQLHRARRLLMEVLA